MLTLRQIEVIRAVMVTGTIGGAARLLNVSAPGLSRMMKHAESLLGLKLFQKRGGRYLPTREAAGIFSQINGVYDKVEDLQFVLKRLRQGIDAELRVAAVPSLSTVVVPRAIADVRGAYPSLLIDVDVLKLEDAVDYLLLGKGEAVAMSYPLEHPLLVFEPLASGRLKCVVPAGHPLAARTAVTAAEIAAEPLVGIDPTDPYGRIMASLFAREGLAYNVTIRARFGSTVCALVTNGLGIAVIDEFTLAGGNWPGLRVLDIVEQTVFQTYVARRRDAALTTYCERFIADLRRHIAAVAGGKTEHDVTQPVQKGI